MKFHWQLTKFDFVQFMTKIPDAELINYDLIGCNTSEELSLNSGSYYMISQ